MSRTQQRSVTTTARLVFGTGNRKKAAELMNLLAGLPVELQTLADFSDPLAIDEAGDSFAENAALKATLQAAHLHAWVLGDDSGLVVDALDGAPGIYSARYAGPTANDEDNRNRLLEQLAGVELPRRTAHFECHLALADPTGTLRRRAPATATDAFASSRWARSASATIRCSRSSSITAPSPSWASRSKAA